MKNRKSCSVFRKQRPLLPIWPASIATPIDLSLQCLRRNCGSSRCSIAKERSSGTVGQPGRFGNIRFSPDGKRLLVMKNDPQTGNNNIWVLDIATGKATAITNETQPINSPVWSHDGKQIAYVLFKDSYSSVYRKAADGTGDAELLFRYTPGAGVGLTDWSPDAKFLTFSTGVLLIVPAAKPGEAAGAKSSGMVA